MRRPDVHFLRRCDDDSMARRAVNSVLALAL
jgi:hypothetical protein